MNDRLAGINRAVRTAGGWIRSAKRSLGYYRLRARLHRPAFRRALRSADTFLVGHPKSGNTWVAYMIAAMRQPAGADVTLANVGRYVPFVHGHDHRIARYDHLADPRVFRNEYPRYRDLYPRMIYLIRDPRSVMPSLWHMYRTMSGDERLPIEKFIDQYLAANGIFRYWNSDLVRWDRQVGAAIAAAPTDPRILLCRYEDFIADRRGSLERVVRFLGVAPEEGALDRAAELGDFNAMRRLESRYGAEAYRGRAAGRGDFVRKGQPDGWVSELTPPLVARLEAALGPVMDLAGYPRT